MIALLLAGCGGPPPSWTGCARFPAHFATDPTLWVPSSIAEELGTDELPYIVCDAYIECDQGSWYAGELYEYGNVQPVGMEPGLHAAEGQRLRCDACNYANGAALDFSTPDLYWPTDPVDTCGWDAQGPDEYVMWTDSPERALRDARRGAAGSTP